MRQLIILFALMPVVATAQISIVEYRNMVIEYSYTLKKNDIAIDYATALYQVKRTDFLPSLTISGEFSEQFRDLDNQEQWNFSMQPQISQTIYNGGSVRATAQKAALAVEAAKADRRYSLLEICYTADYAYYDLMAKGSYRDAVVEYVSIISSLKRVVELRYDEGYISKGDLLMIETRLSEALYEQIALDEDYTIALQKFNILRGFEADAEVELYDIDVERVVPPQRASLEELLDRRPDYMASLLAEAEAESSIVIARAAYNPTLSLGAASLWRTQSPNVNGSTTMDGSLFLRLSAPIFHFGERRHAVNAAYELRRSSSITTLDLIDAIRLEESNMWASVVDSKAQLDAARQSLSIGSENLEISTYSYSEGLTTILDVMQAQISWLQLYANSIWSEFNYLISISAYRKIAAIDEL
ncbi:MAG: TolC family protein [Rikenellaceae bacterium]